MKKAENASKEKRFRKNHSISHQVKKHPWRCINKVFETFSLKDLRTEMKQWMGSALINDQSAYEQGKERGDLMEFSEKILLLAEALYVMNKKHQAQKQSKTGNTLPDQVIESIKETNQLTILNAQQINNPEIAINSFCKKFSYDYCNCEIWDLLDAVITYEQDSRVYKGNLVLFCQCLLTLVTVACIFHNDKRI
jgi:hypothetical protein